MEEKTVKKPMRKPARRKVCAFCAEKVEVIDYKDVKILPRRMSGVCAMHQRELSNAIKRARIVALLPFKGE